MTLRVILQRRAMKRRPDYACESSASRSRGRDARPS